MIVAEIRRIGIVTKHAAKEGLLSRTEELRNKFRDKGRAAVAEVKSPRGQFVSALHAFTAEAHAASSWDKNFEDGLYKRFEADAPPDLTLWLASVTRGLFRSVNEPPAWVGEVDWCFEDGVPLGFLAQFSDDEGVTYYVFRGSDERRHMFFKMCAWCGEDKTILNGKIQG